LIEGFVWGALIGACIQYVGFRNWAILFGGLYVAGYFVNASEQRGIADATASGAKVEIVRFNTADPYQVSLVARVANPSSKTLKSFSAKCANIYFENDNAVPPGNVVLIHIPSFFRDRFGEHRIDPFVDRRPVPCLLKDASVI